MTQVFRRVVTAETADGKSIVRSDGPAPCFVDIVDGLRLTDIWMTDAVPADLPLPDSDPTMPGPLSLMPNARGTKFRIVEVPPDDSYLHKISSAEIFDKIGAQEKIEGQNGSRHPTMHKTETIDYVIMLSGEIYLVLDDSEILLRAGDCVVQGGASHAWSNRSDKPAIFAAVLVGASDAK